MFTIYLVQYNSDTIEGRGPMLSEVGFVTPELAAEYAETTHNNYGQGAIERGWARVVPLDVYDAIPPARDVRRGELRRSALAKLNAQEREALGIELDHAYLPRA